MIRLLLVILAAWVGASILAAFIFHLWFTRYQRKANRYLTKRRNR